MSDNEVLSRKRRKDNGEYLAFARRMMRAYGRRVGEADPAALRDMVQLSDELDQAIAAAVTGLRASGFSWGEIGRELNMTRQAARQRWSQ